MGFKPILASWIAHNVWQLAFGYERIYFCVCAWVCVYLRIGVHTKSALDIYFILSRRIEDV